MKNKYVIVISFDAVSEEDLEFLSKQPNFSKLIKNGALIKNVESVYPSLTYPAHATIVTGKYPKNHGVINNTVLDFKNDNPDWYWYRKYIKGDTIFDLAEKSGMKTCSILWPVTARSKITYNMPEIFCTKRYDNQILKSALAGSKIYQVNMNKKFGYLRQGMEEPYLDNFATEVAKKTIRELKPNLILLHLIDSDSQKHKYGIENKEVIESLKRHDERLGEIIESLKLAGIYEDSTIIALGDHSQINVNNVIKLNSILMKNDLINVNGNKIKSYKAIAKSCDGSSYIYLKNKNDVETRKKVRDILNELKNKYSNVIEEVYNNEEIKNLGADINASFMIEAKRGYYFIDDFLGEAIEVIDESSKIKHKLRASHGYLPSRDNYKTFFIAYGKTIKKGVVLEKGKLINHGPTIAKILEIDLRDCDGIVEERILNL
ncbi:ectonucleotide pyrophosphatase/phosphodiesterase [uncultured Clostridium sp.]|jgi:predicted AlkP superfamily pyrophosphatase or phosphodiesterase|uniref:alkaline phosphatase family protein n=1 Tax=uncultured Clostridium sp. TaxID=59620 RepID=UPI0025E5BE89|nr:ectonucleotide pyrophosphatase/phosphodiesterase [uncultured Clostridium sp.]